jgi:outer membrane protein assembly factor BamE
VLKHCRPAVVGLVSLVLLLSGCWPRPYKLNITQGNRFVQSKLEHVEPGMTREQVEYLLGAPVVIEPFQKNRWDYLYLWQPGYGQPIRRMVSIYFSDDDRVTRIEGDLKYTLAPDEKEEKIDPSKPLPELPELPKKKK